MDLINLVHIGLYLVNLVILYFLLKHFLYKTVTKFLKQRRERVEAQLAEADEKLADANELKKEYEGMVASAKTEAAGIISKAQDHAAVEYQDMLDKGKRDVEEMKEYARHEIELQRRDVYDKLREDVIDMSVQLAGKVLEREVSAEDNRKVIDEYFKSVG